MFEWDNQVDLGDLLTAAGFLLAFAGLVFVAIELRRNSRAMKAQFLLDITERYFSDSEVRRFYYKLDYGKFNLALNSFIGSQEEVWLDSIIYTFDMIGRVVKLKAVKISDVDILAFQASRVLRNPEVNKYLEWLDKEYQREGKVVHMMMPDTW